MVEPAPDLISGDGRRGAVRRAILSAARAELLERGVDKFSVESVAKRAHCSRATLFRHTGGKKALLDEVFAEAADRVNQRVTARIAGYTGEARVVESILAAVAELRADRVVMAWLGGRDVGKDRYLGRTSALPPYAESASGAIGEDLAGAWVHRVVLSLIVWPLDDREQERRLVEAYVAPAFRVEDPATGSGRQDQSVSP